MNACCTRTFQSWDVTRKSLAFRSSLGTKVCRYNWHSAGSLGWPFPVLKYKYIFSNKIYGRNFIKQHSETVMARNSQNADCSLRKNIILSFYHNFRQTFVPCCSFCWTRRKQLKLFLATCVLLFYRILARLYSRLSSCVHSRRTELTCNKLTQLHHVLLVARVSVKKLIGCRQWRN